MKLPRYAFKGEVGRGFPQLSAALLQEYGDKMRLALERLSEESRPTLLVARELRNFAQLLRADMDQEEETALREDLLRDPAPGAATERE